MAPFLPTDFVEYVRIAGFSLSAGEEFILRSIGSNSAFPFLQDRLSKRARAAIVLPEPRRWRQRSNLRFRVIIYLRHLLRKSLGGEKVIQKQERYGENRP
jgi:hypothetical protein